MSEAVDNKRLLYDYYADADSAHAHIAELEAELSEANKKWEKADVAVYTLLDNKNRLVLLIGELKRALNRCLGAMDAHDKRMSGEYKIPGETMNCMWQGAKSDAKAALAAIVKAEEEAK